MFGRMEKLKLYQRIRDLEESYHGKSGIHGWEGMKERLTKLEKVGDLTECHTCGCVLFKTAFRGRSEVVVKDRASRGEYSDPYEVTEDRYYCKTHKKGKTPYGEIK